MNGIQFDPNGGDMGRALAGPINAKVLVAVIPHVAEILQELHNSKLSPLPFKYGFEITIADKAEVEMVIPRIKEVLPPNVSFYTVDGRSLFEIRSASGGLASTCICYLFTHDT